MQLIFQFYKNRLFEKKKKIENVNFKKLYLKENYGFTLLKLQKFMWSLTIKQ